jgi:hypothetical protein
MKSKEEIEQLANKYSSLGQAAGLSNREYTLENIAYRRGYEQCQEDMADNFLSLIEEYREKELPDRNVPYHYEAEISSGLNFLIQFIKNKKD